MSHYTVVATTITSRKHLISALQDMGFKRHMIEESDNLLPLKGFQGDVRKQQANVRIKGSGWRGQNYVGGMSNDLGFELQNDGTYLFHVSDYDKGKYNSTWQEQLINHYSKHVVQEDIEMAGFYITEEQVMKNGEIRLTVSAG